MARIVPGSPFRRGYEKTQYQRSHRLKNAERWTSPEGVSTAVNLGSSVGAVVAGAVQEKLERGAILEANETAKATRELAAATDIGMFGRAREYLGLGNEETAQAAVRSKSNLALAAREEEAALAPYSTANAMSLASGARTLQARKDATEKGLGAYDRSRAATLGGMVLGQGADQTTKMVKRMFPQEKRQGGGGGLGHRPYRPGDEKVNYKASKGKMSQMQMALQLRDGGMDDESLGGQIWSTTDALNNNLKIAKGTKMLAPNQAQLRALANPETTQATVDQLVTGYRVVVDLAKNANLDSMYKDMGKHLDVIQKADTLSRSGDPRDFAKLNWLRGTKEYADAVRAVNNRSRRAPAKIDTGSRDFSQADANTYEEMGRASDERAKGAPTNAACRAARQGGRRWRPPREGAH